MNAATEATENNDLSDTLTKALAQSQQLIKRLAEKSAEVETLKKENEQLQAELTESRAQNNTDDARKAYDLKVQELFERDAEKQIQIEELTKKLLRVEAKERKWRQRYPLLSSPVPSSEGRLSHNNSPTPGHASDLSHAHPAPLGAVSSTKTVGSGKENVPPIAPHLPGLDAATEFQSDGVVSPLDDPLSYQQPLHEEKSEVSDHEKHENSVRIMQDVPNTASSSPPGSIAGTSNSPSVPVTEKPKQRLEALLTTPIPSNPTIPRIPLSRPNLSSPLQKESRTEPPSLKPTSPSTNIVTPTIRPNQVTRSSFLPQKRKYIPGPEDEEPFRARPMHRLNLTHFKLNPSTNNGIDYAYQETIRSRAERKCLPGCTRPECCGNIFRALIDTIGPNNLDTSNLTNPSEFFHQSSKNNEDDDKLLLEFLGPGSESKIKTLTNLARENLLHEARAKKWADLYGKHRPTTDRPASPPGFWNTEMPGSQEEIDMRERVRLMEREEVGRRYREALRDGGRWVFADE